MSCNFGLFFNFFVPKSYVFESFRWGINPMDFVHFPFKTSKLKNDISYIKYKFSHRFWKVCRWLNMYYSKIRIITFFKVATMSIWIILKNLVWTYRECNFCWYWATIVCIYPNRPILKSFKLEKEKESKPSSTCINFKCKASFGVKFHAKRYQNP
jgi:hypothetical protein